MRVFLEFHDTSDYLGSEARRRGIDERALCRRLVNQIVRDKMVLAVLDDDGAPVVRAQSTRSTARLNTFERRQQVLRLLREQGRPSTMRELGGMPAYATVAAMVRDGELVSTQPAPWPPTKFYSLPSSSPSGDGSVSTPRGAVLPSPDASPTAERHL